MDYSISKVSQLKNIAEDIVSLGRKKKEKPFVVALKGEIGVGKTALVKQIAKELLVKENVTSPTFLIQKTYTTSDKDFLKLIHIDLYRLSSYKQADCAGFSDALKDKDAMVCIEWPENISFDKYDCLVEASSQGDTHRFKIHI